MFQSGKMPVVIGVLLLILVGIFGTLIAMERRLARTERELEKSKGKESEREGR